MPLLWKAGLSALCFDLAQLGRKSQQNYSVELIQQLAHLHDLLLRPHLITFWWNPNQLVKEAAQYWFEIHDPCVPFFGLSSHWVAAARWLAVFSEIMNDKWCTFVLNIKSKGYVAIHWNYFFSPIITFYARSDVKYSSNHISRYMKYGKYCLSIRLIWIVWSLSENTALMR